MPSRPPSDGDGGEAPRIALPKNIAETLKYLDDLDLETLRVSVENELRRRRTDKEVQANASAVTHKLLDAPAPGGVLKRVGKQAASSLPIGKASLIRASSESGMKPQAIARTLRIPVVQVNEVLASTVKRKS